MSWLEKWLDRTDKKTFDQELELIVARWTDMSRKGSEALSAQEVGRRLIHKGEQLTGTEKTRKK